MKKMTNVIHRKSFVLTIYLHAYCINYAKLYIGESDSTDNNVNDFFFFFLQGGGGGGYRGSNGQKLIL